MPLTGDQSERLNKLLVSAFPTFADLKRLTQYNLEVQLDAIVGNSNTTDAAFELVNWAVAHGRLDDLIRGAVKENPDRQDLRAFAQEVGVNTDPAISADSRAAHYRVWIVDSLHRGDFPTIAEAITAASAGDRIEVRPGTYDEGLVIDKPLELVGVGDRDSIVVQATGKPVIVFRTSAGRVQNLTLRQRGGGEWFGVDIGQGHLELDNCDIQSASRAGVAIHDGADPHLHHNRIHDGRQVGVYVYDNGLGTLEDNDIAANAYSGVFIKTGGNPTLRRNRIHDGKQNGVLVWEDGAGILEDNDIFGNAYSGIEIKSRSNPTVRHNRINRNAGRAVYIHEDGRGTIEDNDLRDNKQGAWKISTGSLGHVTRSRNLE
jgi:F-box protein 11